ncbi:MAG: lytic transglycosylase domain-containing protein [Flavobacteriales bacterium]|nr:lytic transglycosylase domain-containing protein [Flavobacteriales bacterium]
MKICLLFLATVLLPFGLAAQDPIAVNDPVLERLDALSQLPWLKNDPFTTDVGELNTHNFAPGVVPTYSPEVYQQRLLELDERTPFKLTYNKQVQAYVDMYAERKREQTGRMLGMAQLYFPAFEEALDRYGLPQELKYLAVVESALYPGARSRAAAVGLWQFIIGTGKLYGLRVDSYVDERCDVYKSTDAACRYLRDLHEAFGDWELALAAYNCGPGNVNKAVRRAGGTMDYWKIYDHLPRETRGYVPAFIAVNYIFNHASDHNIYPVIPNYCAYEVDTMQIRYPWNWTVSAASSVPTLRSCVISTPCSRWVWSR